MCVLKYFSRWECSIDCIQSGNQIFIVKFSLGWITCFGTEYQSSSGFKIPSTMPPKWRNWPSRNLKNPLTPFKPLDPHIVSFCGFLKAWALSWVVLVWGREEGCFPEHDKELSRAKWELWLVIGGWDALECGWPAAQNPALCLFLGDCGLVLLWQEVRKLGVGGRRGAVSLWFSCEISLSLESSSAPGLYPEESSLCVSNGSRII